MVAASCAFATPIGYQTNTLVYGPGGYKFTDFTRVGLGMNLLMGVAASVADPRLLSALSGMPAEFAGRRRGRSQP